MQYLTFVNGRLRNIEDGPRGFKGDMLAGSSKSRCGHLVERGDRKIEVIINCGAPYSIEHFWEERFSDVSNSVRVRKILGYHGDASEFKKDYKIVRERMYKQKSCQ